MGRWGSLQGGLGVCIIVAGAALGAIITMVMRAAPGFALGLFVVIGTVVAAFAVRPRAGRLIFPVPVLSYLVAALVSGIVFSRSAAGSRTELAIGAAQWVANGFFAMAVASICGLVIIGTRWLLWRRGRKVAGRPAGGVPSAGGPRAAGLRNADSWGEPGSRNRTSRPGTRSGSGPYNFSSGA
jgi:hypothetical protein